MSLLRDRYLEFLSGKAKISTGRNPLYRQNQMRKIWKKLSNEEKEEKIIKNVSCFRTYVDKTPEDADYMRQPLREISQLVMSLREENAIEMTKIEDYTQRYFKRCTEKYFVDSLMFPRLEAVGMITRLHLYFLGEEIFNCCQVDGEEATHFVFKEGKTAEEKKGKVEKKAKKKKKAKKAKEKPAEQKEGREVAPEAVVGETVDKSRTPSPEIMAEKEEKTETLDDQVRKIAQEMLEGSDNWLEPKKKTGNNRRGGNFRREHKANHGPTSDSENNKTKSDKKKGWKKKRKSLDIGDPRKQLSSPGDSKERKQSIIQLTTDVPNRPAPESDQNMLHKSSIKSQTKDGESDKMGKTTSSKTKAVQDYKSSNVSCETESIGLSNENTELQSQAQVFPDGFDDGS
jgi:hypothetical protein